MLSCSCCCTAAIVHTCTSISKGLELGFRLSLRISPRELSNATQEEAPSRTTRLSAKPLSLLLHFRGSSGLNTRANQPRSCLFLEPVSYRLPICPTYRPACPSFRSLVSSSFLSPGKIEGREEKKKEKTRSPLGTRSIAASWLGWAPRSLLPEREQVRADASSPPSLSSRAGQSSSLPRGDIVRGEDVCPDTSGGAVPLSTCACLPACLRSYRDLQRHPGALPLRARLGRLALLDEDMCPHSQFARPPPPPASL